MNKEILSVIKEEFDMVPEAFGGEVNREEICLAVSFSEYLRKACYNELNIQF